MPKSKSITDSELEMQLAAMGVNPDKEAVATDSAPKAELPENTDKVLVDIPPVKFGEEETLVVTVNGKNYTMDRGNSYYLPKAVAAEYERSVRAATRGHKRKKELLRKEAAINAHADAVIAGKVAAD